MRITGIVGKVGKRPLKIGQIGHPAVADWTQKAFAHHPFHPQAGRHDQIKAVVPALQLGIELGIVGKGGHGHLDPAGVAEIAEGGLTKVIGPDCQRQCLSFGCTASQACKARCGHAPQHQAACQIHRLTL